MSKPAYEYHRRELLKLASDVDRANYLADFVYPDLQKMRMNTSHYGALATLAADESIKLDDRAKNHSGWDEASMAILADYASQVELIVEWDTERTGGTVGKGVGRITGAGQYANASRIYNDLAEDLNNQWEDFYVQPEVRQATEEEFRSLVRTKISEIREEFIPRSGEGKVAKYVAYTVTEAHPEVPPGMSDAEKDKFEEEMGYTPPTSGKGSGTSDEQLRDIKKRLDGPEPPPWLAPTTPPTTPAPPTVDPSNLPPL